LYASFMVRSGFRFLRASSALVVAAGWCACAAAAAENPSLAGTLPEDIFPGLKAILQTALSQSPQTIQQEFDVAAADARTYIINSARLPHLGGSADYAANETSISSDANSRTRDTGLFYQFHLDQSLFRWGELKNKSEQAKLGVLIAEKNFREVYRTLAVRLRSSYLELIVKKAALRQLRATQQLAEKDYAVAQDQFARHDLAAGTLKTKELALRESALALQRAEDDFTFLVRIFARSAGLKELSGAEIPDEVPLPTYSAALAKTLLSDALRDGGKFSFAVEIDALRARDADLAYRIARVNLLPKLGASAGYSLQNNTNVNGSSVSQTGVAQETVGIHVDWNIFDGVSTRGSMREALANKRLYDAKAKADAEDALDRLQQLERTVNYDGLELEFPETRLSIARGFED